MHLRIRLEFDHVSEPNFSRQACRSYVKGLCNKGPACTFSHEPEDLTAFQAEEANGTSESERPKKGRGVCYWWQGTCRSANCPYMHEKEGSGSEAKEGVEEAVESKRDAVVTDEKSQSDTRVGEEMPDVEGEKKIH